MSVTSSRVDRTPEIGAKINASSRDPISSVKYFNPERKRLGQTFDFLYLPCFNLDDFRDGFLFFGWRREETAEQVILQSDNVPKMPIATQTLGVYNFNRVFRGQWKNTFRP